MNSASSNPAQPSAPLAPLAFSDLGRLGYAPAYERQVAGVEEVLAWRDAASTNPATAVGRVFFVEHDPVVTVSRRPEAREHLVATPELLARDGVAVAETDRGGDITYHGPGQLVAYPILDLNRLNLGLHEYMRLLEEAVIRTCAAFGVATTRDPKATGVWTLRDGAPHAKICAMGVRVRKWISMHGLAINVSTNLDHFSLIVPCGLVGRPVTSLARELGPNVPEIDAVKRELAAQLSRLVNEAAAQALARRAAADAASPPSHE